MEATLQPQHHEEIEGQGSDTQEPVTLHLPVKDTADNQVDGEIKIQEEVATKEPTIRGNLRSKMGLLRKIIK